MWHQRRHEIEEETHSRRSRIRHQRDDLFYSFRPGGFLDPTNTTREAEKEEELRRERKPRTKNKYTKQLMDYEESLGTER